MDPAHIPFAHHGLQGKRDDACEIPMQMLENSNEKIDEKEEQNKETDHLYFYRFKP